VRVAHHHLLDLALAVQQDADLAVRLDGQLREVPGQLGADDLVRRDPTAVRVAELLELAGLEAEGVPVQVFQRRSPAGSPGAATGGDLAISGPLRSSMRAASGGRTAGSRVPRPARNVVHWWAVSRFLVVLLLAGCATAPPANVRITPGTPPESARLHARPEAKFRQGQPGLFPLGLGSPRDGLLYIPQAANTRRVPLLVMLHGAGSEAARMWEAVKSDAEERQVAVVMPDSRLWSWDFAHGDFGADRAFLDEALDETFRRVPIDPARIALGGFSAGATFTLSIGPSNGDLFRWLFAFSPTGMEVAGRVGKPRFMVVHGTVDSVVPIGQSSRAIVPALRANGDWVVYREFPGDHEIFPDAVHEAFGLLVSD
jgi:phospholipase/carboxylesterase